MLKKAWFMKNITFHQENRSDKSWLLTSKNSNRSQLYREVVKYLKIDKWTAFTGSRRILWYAYQHVFEKIEKSTSLSEILLVYLNNFFCVSVIFEEKNSLFPRVHKINKINCLSKFKWLSIWWTCFNNFHTRLLNNFPIFCKKQVWFTSLCHDRHLFTEKQLYPAQIIAP